jgi:hypothetical protein
VTLILDIKTKGSPTIDIGDADLRYPIWVLTVFILCFVLFFPSV